MPIDNSAGSDPPDDVNAPKLGASHMALIKILAAQAVRTYLEEQRQQTRMPGVSDNNTIP